MVLVDALARQIPGVVGRASSVEEDSFALGLLDWPHYTRPEVYRGLPVPEVLLSGHHANVEEWRRKMAIEKTKAVRPDLYERWKSERGGQSGKPPAEREDPAES
jgi:tRNA (guanine37-N1)-methyltransferase